MGRAQDRDIRVLYVTEDSDEADSFQRALAQEPSFTVTATSRIDVRFDDCEEPIDCLVWRDEGSGDWEVWVQRCDAVLGDVPVVLLGPNDGMVASQALDAGVAGFVPQSADEAAVILIDRIRSLVGQGDQEESVRKDNPNIPLEEELRLKEQAIEESPIGITISDNSKPDNPLLFLNDAFVELTGYTKQEVRGRNCRFLQGEKSKPRAVAAMREAIDREESVSVELVNYRKNGEEFWNKVDIAPIHDETGDVKNFVGFQTDITARKEAELDVKRERRHLEHLLERINGLLQNILGDLVTAPDRDAVEQAVCNRIANTDVYTFCWIGRPSLSMDTLTATTWAGEFAPSEQDLTIDMTTKTPNDNPHLQAFESRQVVVVDEPHRLAGILGNDAWLDRDVAGIASIPLVYQDTRYGMLTVYTEQENALNDREVVVLEALGRAAATAINALERGRIIGSDHVIELGFEIRDPELFIIGLAKKYNTEVEYNGSIFRDDGSILMFLTTDIDPAEVTDSLSDHSEVNEVSVINDAGNEKLYEIRLGRDSIISALTERGVKIRSLTASSGSGNLTVELPTETEARAIVELLRERFSEIELVRQLDHSRPPETEQEFISELTASLTDRQLTVLQKAYLSGYFALDRPVSGDELANSMGISRPTFHQHLRAAHRKIGEKLFGETK